MQNKVNNSSYHHYIKIENWGSKRLPIKLSLYVFLLKNIRTDSHKTFC